MNVQRAVRWSGSGICNGRQRLQGQAVHARFYSINGHTLSQRSSKGRGNHLRIRNAVQARPISLWSWGSSSKSASDEFAAVHSAPQATPPQSNVTDVLPVQEPAIGATRTIKASHATSDQPEPSILTPSPNPPHTPEPAILHDLENKLLSPHVADSPKPPIPVEDTTLFSSIPESYGYLHDVCGLDFGWGTTTLEEWAIEHIHYGLGFSWAASIPLLAIAIRLILLKPMLDASDMTQRIKEANPYLKPTRDQYIAAAREQDTVKAMGLKVQMNEITREYGVKMWKLFLPMVFQIPLSFSAFRLLRNMSTLPVPAFETESWLWTSDLTHGDPYMIVPLITSTAMYFNIRMGMQSGTPSPIMKMFKNIFPFANFAFMFFQPGSVQLFFMSSTLLSIGQTALINNPRIRSILRLHKIVIPPPKNETSAAITEVAGMNLARPASKIIDVTPTTNTSPTPAKDSSMIDKLVDNVKSVPTSLMDNFRETKEAAWGKAETKLEKKRQTARKEHADKYEAHRRREKEWEREGRNTRKLDVSMVNKPVPGTRVLGGMRIVDKKEERERR